MFRQILIPLEWSMYKGEDNTYLAELGGRFEAEGIKADLLLKEGHPAQPIIEAILKATPWMIKRITRPSRSPGKATGSQKRTRTL